MKAVWSAAQIQGQRDYQEDYFAVLESDLVFYKDQQYELAAGSTPENQSLLILADGMGGMGHGDLAASQVVENFIKYYLIAVQHDMNIEERFKAGLDGANEALARLIAEDPEKEGMGTTLIALLWDELEESIYWLSVGDSMLQLYVAGKPLQRLNSKHTWGEQRGSVQLEDQVAVMSEEQLDEIKDALCAAVDGTALDFIDLQTAGYPLSVHEQVLIASDGLETLDDQQIARLAGQDLLDFEAGDLDNKVESVSAAVKSLIAAVEEAGKPNQDNTSLMVMGLAQLVDQNTESSPESDEQNQKLDESTQIT